jgi:hypothetical protein
MTMVFRKSEQRVPQLPTADGIPPIATNPRYSAALAVCVALRAGLDTIEHEIALLTVDEYLSHRPDDKRARENRDRLRQRKGVGDQGAAPRTEAGGLPAEVLAGLEIVRGGPLSKPKPSRRARIAELDEQRAIVHRAFVIQAAAVEEVRGELSVALANHLRSQQDALAAAYVRAAQQLAAISDAELAFARRFREAGYTWRPDLLPFPSLRAALVLGSEADGASEVSRMRQTLEEAGVL